ncbi:MAG TPA: helicase C-terminal domain-containing protein [Bacteroidota bacterium]
MIGMTRETSEELRRLFLRAEEIWPGFEQRPQQVAMARAVAEALSQRSSLIVEAPTGIGKTLAYLIPAILEATRSDRKAVVSTHTKNLQDQLLLKDVPMVRELLGVPFSAMVLKGRRNYLCTTRLRTALTSATGLFTAPEREELERIKKWAIKTLDGDVEGLGFVPSANVWDMVASEPGLCNPRSCRGGCFYQRARERARTAQLVIMNHALFFLLLSRQEDEDNLVFTNDFVIFDEAHTLETVASAGMGIRLSRSQLLGRVLKLYNPKNRKGMLARQKKPVKDLCREAADEIKTFFGDVAKAAAYTAPAGVREIRLRAPWVVGDTVTPVLQRLQAELVRLEEAGKGAAGPGELGTIAAELESAAATIVAFLEQSVPDSAYWIDLGAGSDTNVTLCASPHNVGAVIGPRLFHGGTSVIMTSATLAVNGSAEFFQRRVGASAVPFFQLDSPFHHARQMRLCIAPDMPEPDSAGYARALPGRLLQAIDRTRGAALVLFTNTAMMRDAAAVLGPALEERGYRLLVQGPQQTRHRLLEAFKRDLQSVLFGLDSFWTGIDVPGEALQHVVITKLPFVVPNHPLVEAKLEAIVRAGGNPFVDFTLPEAVLKFRQGVGRLIRTMSDRGIVTILDSRIVRKSYGRVFLSSIPRCPVEFMSLSGGVEEVQSEQW